MTGSQMDADEIFETLLRRHITDAVIGGAGRGTGAGRHLIARLRRFDRRARSEQLSSQTLQVIASARRLLGDREPARTILDRTARGRRTFVRRRIG